MVSHVWLLFAYKAPPKPARKRVALWRRLNAMGAAFFALVVELVEAFTIVLAVGVDWLGQDLALLGFAIPFLAVGLACAALIRPPAPAAAS